MTINVLYKAATSLLLLVLSLNRHQTAFAFVTPSDHGQVKLFSGSSRTKLNMEVVEVDVAIVGGGPAGEFLCAASTRTPTVPSYAHKLSQHISLIEQDVPAHCTHHEPISPPLSWIRTPPVERSPSPLT